MIRLIVRFVVELAAQTEMVKCVCACVCDVITRTRILVFFSAKAYVKKKKKKKMNDTRQTCSYFTSLTFRKYTLFE